MIPLVAEVTFVAPSTRYVQEVIREHFDSNYKKELALINGETPPVNSSSSDPYQKDNIESLRSSVFSSTKKEKVVVNKYATNSSSNNPESLLPLSGNLLEVSIAIEALIYAMLNFMNLAWNVMEHDILLAQKNCGHIHSSLESDKHFDYRIAECLLAKDIKLFINDNTELLNKELDEMRKELHLFARENKKYNFRLHFDVLNFFKKASNK